jgi:hypothetical protein
MGQKLGTAEVQYGDFRGTVAIDGPDQSERLYELAGLSRDEWSIVAYDIFGSYDHSWARVWAVPQAEASWDNWERMAREGASNVSAQRFDFQVDDEEAGATLLQLNKRWSVHALFRSLADLGLDVETSESE